MTVVATGGARMIFVQDSIDIAGEFEEIVID
jgi:hypothetical protein